MTSTLYTERLVCTCKECSANARSLGRDVLAARVRPEYIAQFGTGSKARHNVVWLANHPMLSRGQSLGIPA